MLNQKPVLIVEDNVYLALDLSCAVEDMCGRVVGPTRTAAEAIELLRSEPVAAAILDCQLADDELEPLAGRLAQLQVPFIIHTASHPPACIRANHPDIPVLFKPLQPSAVLACLLVQIAKAAEHGGTGRQG